jgi:hypothetical protein
MGGISSRLTICEPAGQGWIIKIIETEKAIATKRRFILLFSPSTDRFLPPNSVDDWGDAENDSVSPIQQKQMIFALRGEQLQSNYNLGRM